MFRSMLAKFWVPLNHGICDDLDEYVGKSAEVS